MSTAPAQPRVLSALFHPAVIVGALGYFVDIYDLVLIGVAGLRETFHDDLDYLES